MSPGQSGRERRKAICQMARYNFTDLFLAESRAEEHLSKDPLFKWKIRSGLAGSAFDSRSPSRSLQGSGLQLE